MKIDWKTSQLRLLIFICLLYLTASSNLSFSQQTDPFYLETFEKAQKAFLVKNYQDAVRDFEIAVFGLTQDKILRAKACVYLGLSYYYLRDIKASEKNLREAADLLGAEGFKKLEIPEEARPDLEKLVTYFDIEQSQTESLPQPLDKQGKPNALTQESKAKKFQNKLGKSSDKASETRIGKIKEGDFVPLELVDTPPLVIKQVEAVYPAWARSHKIEGTIIVNTLISEKGKVIKTEIAQEMKGAPGFNQAAESAVRKWRFDPASVKGVKVKVWMPIAIKFKEQE
jgi:TonB family protein